MQMHPVSWKNAPIGETVMNQRAFASVTQDMLAVMVSEEEEQEEIVVTSLM
jgi:hypothetical protein